MASYSEDAMYKALLRNKPAQQPPKATVTTKKEVPKPVQPVQAVEIQKKEQIIEPKVTPPVKMLDLDPVIESLNRVNSNLNQIYGTIKTVILPVLILIIVVEIGILVRLK